MTTKATYRVRRPGESITLPHLYDWLARAMWTLSAAATAFAVYPLATALAVLLSVPAGAPAAGVGVLLALAIGGAFQFGLSVAERPALKGRFASPVVALALVLDFVTNLGGVSIALPMLAQVLGWTLGGWSFLLYGGIALLLTLGPELAWALALYETKEER